jgi:TetR/AcrR family transcriptional regulator
MPESPTADAEPRSRRMSAEKRRETILAAALAVFAERGLEGGRLREIAARAGITEPYLFRHFTSKAELYEAAVTEPLIRLIERFEEQITLIPGAGRLTGVTLVREINRTILEFMLEAIPYIGVSMFSDMPEGRTFYTTQIYARVHEPIRSLLGCIKGWPSPTVSLDLVANSMWGLNYGIALDALHTGLNIDIAKTADRVSRLYVSGIPRFQSTSSDRA